MKKNIKVYENGGYRDKEINYIPLRFIIAIMLAVIEIILIILIMFLFAIYIPYFYIAIYITVICIVIKIISSNENPDYKVPWIVTVIALPIVGMMLYFMFSKRVLPKKVIKRLKILTKKVNNKEYLDNLNELKGNNELLYTQAVNLCNISETNLYKNQEIKYYEKGELMFKDILESLKSAKEFIFLEYFIIEEGLFWNSILDILKDKALSGVEVKVIYDDIGCMSTLPGNYFKVLKKYKINAVCFSKLRGSADGEFNNRSHRKILVIDGCIGFTGGVNIADEYINVVNRFGDWKDTGIKIVGNSVNELTRLFLIDYYLNDRFEKELNFDKYYKNIEYKEPINNTKNFVIPFGDGPKPIYEKNVGKIAIMNLINHAIRYVYITTPYLIIDNELMRCIENASIRGVDVRIVIPHIPDKKMVFEMTKSSAEVLIAANVKIFEYLPGFVHAKSYIADDLVGIIGTINLDYRSLTHHFENGVWIYGKDCIKEIKADFEMMFKESMLIKNYKVNIIKRFMRAVLKIFTPLL